mmetsp:Transcript_12042/g.26363  ORF Transcript_12042/g.26363 Transcript_12042/m.26363 type:complete len:88 (+) Transcript_12042:313-576(+)
MASQSRWLVGPSRSRTSARCARAAASATRFRSPPDRDATLSRGQQSEVKMVRWLFLRKRWTRRWRRWIPGARCWPWGRSRDSVETVW